MDVSIIIPCKNEVESLPEKIENTLKLGNAIKEVIIVDDHSSDKTYPVATNLAKQDTRIIVIKNNDTPGKNPAVSAALKICSGEIICMTDTDILLPDDTIIKVLPYFEKKNVGMVSLATKLIFNSDKKSQTDYSCFYERFIRFVKIFESTIDSVIVPHGQALFFRKDINLLPTRQADDVDLALQTRKKEFKVKYARNCFFKERVPTDSTIVRKQKIRRCKAVIDSLLHHKDIFNPHYGLAGLLCYPLDCSIFIAGPFLLLFLVLFTTAIISIFVHPVAGFFLIMTFFIILFFTRYRSILNLSLVNIRAIKEYLREGSKTQWQTPRENYRK